MGLHKVAWLVEHRKKSQTTLQVKLLELWFVEWKLKVGRQVLWKPKVVKPASVLRIWASSLAESTA